MFEGVARCATKHAGGDRSVSSRKQLNLTFKGVPDRWRQGCSTKQDTEQDLIVYLIGGDGGAPMSKQLNMILEGAPQRWRLGATE